MAFGQRPSSSLPASQPSPNDENQDIDTSKVEILYAENLVGRLEGDLRVKTLIGNVQLRQDDVEMRCDSAVIVGNDVSAYGDVIIQQGDSVQIFADSAYYFGDERKSILIGETVLTDGKATLYTERLDYDMNTKIAIYKSGAVLENENTKLYSERGYYYTQTNLAYFGGDVTIEDPEFSLKADTLKLDTDKNISYFIGSTDLLTKDGERIYCENGFYDSQKEYAEFEERARFQSEDGFAKAKKIKYDGKNDKIILEGDAYFKNEEQTAESDLIVYDTARKQFSTDGVTTIQDEGRVIVSDKSFYDDSTNVAVFVGNVCISDSNQIICADSIRYNEESRVGKAFGNVVSRDTVENIMVECERMDYSDSTSYVIATGRPLMTSLVEDDTLFLAADTLYSFSRDTVNFDSLRVIVAQENVRLYKSNFQAICDSLVYDSADSLFQLFYDPVLWSDTSQFTADVVSIFLADEKIDKIELDQKAFLINSSDEVYFNQVKGRTISAHFEEDTLRTMLVNGNGETLYFVQDDAKAYITANKTECSNMKLYFKENQVQDIFFYGQPKGKAHPMEGIQVKALEINGFQWRMDERPKSKDDLKIVPIKVIEKPIIETEVTEDKLETDKK
jgi:lipopolysaccharide transport protein LptA